MTEAGKMYGNALYELAADENLEDQILEELTQVSELICAQPDYLKLLSLPSLPRAERCKALDEVFSGKIHAYLLNFLKLLCEKGEIRNLADCQKQYKAAYNEAHGIVEAVAITAVPMTDAQADALQQKLARITGKTISLTRREDPACIGGVRLEVGGTQLDGTIQNRLDELRRLLSATV